MLLRCLRNSSNQNSLGKNNMLNLNDNTDIGNL